MKTTAIFPGSFDPFTKGHAAIVEQALTMFDRVVVGIGSNIAKNGLLDVDARRRLIEDLYAAEPRVEVKVYSGLTGDLAMAEGAAAILRGVRNTSDFEYERTMEAANRRLFPGLSTVLLFTPHEVADISSSTVREIIRFGRGAEEFLPDGIDLKQYL